jgi:5-methylcytosine-specific restriction endonuclease McrA
MCRKCYHRDQYGTCRFGSHNADGNDGLCGLHRDPLAGMKSYYRVVVRAMILLGGSCSVCGENDFSVLEFDHIHNDGKSDLRPDSSRKTSWYVAKDVLSGKSEHIQLLCANCHSRKTKANGESSLRAVLQEMGLG